MNQQFSHIHLYYAHTRNRTQSYVQGLKREIHNNLRMCATNEFIKRSFSYAKNWIALLSRFNWIGIDRETWAAPTHRLRCMNKRITIRIMANYHGCFAMIISLGLMYLSWCKSFVAWLRRPFFVAHICSTHLTLVRIYIYISIIDAVSKISLAKIYFAYYLLFLFRFCSLCI